MDIGDNAFEQNKMRMRMGTGAGNILYGNEVKTHHYIDALERFQKDFATAEKQRRQQERARRESEIERKRIQQLQRENKRWESVQSQYSREKQRRDHYLQEQIEGVKRIHNTNGLEYQNSNKGMELKTRDEDQQIRGFVRAHNMQTRGNGKYNPLTGEARKGVEKIIPPHLGQRFQVRLNDHYDTYKLRVPSSTETSRRVIQ